MLNRAQVKLRQDISRINKRLARFEAAGVSSPAAERLLTAVGAEGGRLHAPPKGATLSQEMALQQAINRFLAAKTSTLGGYKRVQERRRQRTFQSFQDMGFSGEIGDMDAVLQGAQSFSHIAQLFSISSDDVRVEYVRGANRGENNARVMERLEKMYGEPELEPETLSENDIDDVEK